MRGLALVLMMGALDGCERHRDGPQPAPVAVERAVPMAPRGALGAYARVGANPSAAGEAPPLELERTVPRAPVRPPDAGSPPAPQGVPL